MVRLLIISLVPLLLASSVVMAFPVQPEASIAPIPNYIAPNPGQIKTCQNAQTFFLSLPPKCLTDKGLQVMKNEGPMIVPAR